MDVHRITLPGGQEIDPRAKGFNYGAALTPPDTAEWGAIKAHADKLRRKAEKAEQAAWDFDMVARGVWVACDAGEQEARVARLAASIGFRRAEK